TDQHPIWWDEDYWGEWVGTFESAVRWHIDRYISRDGRRYSIELVSQREADDITYLKHQLEIEQLINQHFPQRHNGIDAIKLLMSMHKLSSQQVVEVASLVLWFVES